MRKMQRYAKYAQSHICTKLTCLFLRPICKPNLKCLASSTPKIWPGTQNVEICHMTLITPTWGIVRLHKANTTRGQVVVLAGFLYASPVSWGFAGVLDRQKVEGFLCRSTWAGFCSKHSFKLTDLCLEAWSRDQPPICLCMGVTVSELPR